MKGNMKRFSDYSFPSDLVLVTPAQLADRLEVSVHVVEYWIKRKYLPVCKIGRQNLINFVAFRASSEDMAMAENASEGVVALQDEASIGFAWQKPVKRYRKARASGKAE